MKKKSSNIFVKFFGKIGSFFNKVLIIPITKLNILLIIPKISINITPLNIRANLTLFLIFFNI